MKNGWPIWAILLFAILTDWIQADWPHAVFRAAACTACAAYLLLGLNKARRRLRWALLPLALLPLWGLLQLALGSTVWTFATWHASLQWFAYCALFFAALQCPETRSQLRSIAWFGGVFSLYAIIQYVASPGPGDRVLGTFLNHNHYSALIELLLPVALWCLFRDRAKPIFALCAILMILSVAVGGSRMGIVLLLAELLYIGLRTTRKPLLLFGGTALIAALAAGVMWNRFAALPRSHPLDSRQATARASVQMIRDRSVLGYGLGTWPQIYPAYAERDTGFRLIHADDDWLEWAAEGGIPFALIMFLLAGFALRAAWVQPWSIGLIAVMLHSLVEFPLQKQSLWACFVVLLAIAQASARRKQAS
jgi:O-antigen ligase